ncbi:MAG: methyltransferase [Phocaeicola sp.]|nr:methyltransferase [Phocaeicola sp.]
MPNPYFKFKQFTVYHDKCAMKVGTDGVLLGAWCAVAGARRVLDVGTGTGLIALMIAQRSEARITALDVDAAAVEQARENCSASPWAERIDVEQADFCSYRSDALFDCIVSNPPYFVEDVHCPDKQRNMARHTAGLTFSSLLERVGVLLSDEGRFSVVLPTMAVADFVYQAMRHQLYLSRRTQVCTKLGVQPKRTLLEFSRVEKTCQESLLTIESEHHKYTPEFVELVKDFYLYL